MSPIAGVSQAPQAAPVVEATITRLTPASAQPVIVRITIIVSPGWHIGAATPGSSGLPTRLTWMLPTGWAPAETRWPPAQQQISGHDILFVYTDSLQIDATFRVTPPTAGVPVKAVISYGVCRDVCIPGQIEVTLPEPALQRRSDSPTLHGSLDPPVHDSYRKPGSAAGMP